MSYRENIQKARRLAMLQALYMEPAYTMNRHALREQVNSMGYVMSADLLLAEAAWLAETGLVELLELDAMRLTERGADVALDRSQTPGVRRPSPGETNGPQ